MRIAIIGFGTIARSAHVPAMAEIGGFDLRGVVTRAPRGDEPARVFTATEDLLAAIGAELDAVVIATSPDVRYALARQCLDAGLDLLLEKPPAATLGEIDELTARAKAAGRVLFASWHSQHAPAVEAARALLAGKTLAGGRVSWREDVNRWHAGQDWVWSAGGFGVFDPGINALSILTRIVPGRLLVDDAALDVPEGRQTPIAARLKLSGPACDRPIDLEFDWRPRADDEWLITLMTADGREIALRRGGAELWVDGARRETPGPDEYPHLFRTFAELVAARESRVDVEPLRIVEDAFLRGRRQAAPPFAWA